MLNIFQIYRKAIFQALMAKQPHLCRVHIFAKIEEWNNLTHPINEGSEVSLVAIYQSHNFDISTFKDPYAGKNKKFRPK